jgi:glycosyltransferase involved in cell wall biosynthesis
MSKVSVILSVRNGANYLREAIDSILAQEYPDIEIVVVNDGSTDQTEAMIGQFGSRVRSVYQENRGLGAGRNTGIRMATGDYFAFLDHDDLWTPSKISLQMEAMKAAPDEPLVFSHLQQFFCPTLDEEEKKKLVVDRAALPGYLAGTLLVSRERFLQVGFFFEKNEVGEFIDWYIRAKEEEIPMRMLPDVTLYRRVHRDNMGRRKDVYSQNAYLRILKAGLDRRRALV